MTPPRLKKGGRAGAVRRKPNRKKPLRGGLLANFSLPKLSLPKKAPPKPAPIRAAKTPQGQKKEWAGNSSFRLEILVGLFMLAFVILAVRAFDLTILQGESLQRRAQNQHKKKIVVPASRGRFLDRNGKTLAISLPMKSLSVDMDLVENPSRLASQLAPLIGVPRRQLRKKLYAARPGSFPVLQRKLPPEAIRKIRLLNHPALFFQPESKRFYTMGEVTSHVLGFTNFSGKGVEGLERALEKELEGQSGYQVVTRDRLGRIMPKVQRMIPAKPGADIALSIDTTVQYIAYRALLKGVNKSKAKSGFVIVMDPRNGEILALVNQPSFNPNNLADSSAKGRRNRAVADLFEPGSTFKIFTAAAAFETNTVEPDTIIDVEGGKFRVGDRTIRDFHRGDQQLSVRQILQKSSNVGAAKIGLKMGNEAMEGYLYRFGFGQPTGIELGNEPAGSIPDISFYKQVGLANRSYGYGITATPLQLVTATSAAINGGILFPPKLVLGRYDDGRLIPAPPPETKRIVSEETSARLRQILETVVEPEGTATKAAVAGYRVAGKTGTARKAVPGKGYVQGHYYASFVGFIPAEKPQLLIFVGIDEPQGTYYGGLVAAPVFREIAQEILPHLSIFPNKKAELQLPEKNRQSPFAHLGAQLEDRLMGASLDKALEILMKEKIIPEIHGSGLVTRFEKKGEKGPARLYLE
ncbi:MAG: penicillin-binding protein 2 [Magnetococcales bacterium]|nr:penicillin-binding protein 2 [Magnetococcales bacterium]